MESTRSQEAGPIRATVAKQLICAACFETKGPLQQCGRCRRVVYCSRECQKADWETGHKPVCKLISTITEQEGDNQVSAAGRTWDTHLKERNAIIAQLSDMLQENPLVITSSGRRICQDVMRLCKYEPLCLYCFRTSRQLESTSNLKRCPGCRFVHFCTTCPQNHDTEGCKRLKTACDQEFLWLDLTFKVRGEFPILGFDKEMANKTYIPLSTVACWLQYHESLAPKGPLHHELPPMDCELTSTSDDRKMQLTAGLFSTSTIASTVPLTILAALELAIPENKLSCQKHITIHLMSEYEFWRTVFEILLHLMPGLKVITLTMVCNNTLVKYHRKTDKDICRKCQISGKKIKLNYISGSYIDYAKSKHFRKPDIAVILPMDSVDLANPLWLSTTKHLAAAAYPSVFTFTAEEEMKLHEDTVKELGGTFLRKGELNKWRAMMLKFKLNSSTPDMVYRPNKYWFVVDSKPTKG